jgi:antitoxin component YwqK of YwqJK toxin-antitoxin module
MKKQKRQLLVQFRINNNPKLIYLLCLFIVCLTIGALSGQTQNVRDANGLKQGKWVFDLSRDSIKDKQNIMTVAYFTNDTLDGDFKVYCKETIISESFYTKGKKEGIERMYTDKMILKELNCYRNGQLSYKLNFYDNGVIKEEYSLLNDQKNGTYKMYYQNGRLMITSLFENGKLNGNEIHYTKNGNFRLLIEYKDGIVIRTRK